ncbi:LysR family transcriptional regulator, partial [Providencia rettgeri]|nr:LysR family transcriptional regulator [Providencia rettgeri]
ELQQLHAVYASRRYLTPKVRSFIDFLLEELAEPAK